MSETLTAYVFGLSLVIAHVFGLSLGGLFVAAFTLNPLAY